VIQKNYRARRLADGLNQASVSILGIGILTGFELSSIEVMWFYCENLINSCLFLIIVGNTNLLISESI
jgi:hypothetical protein